MEVPFGIFGNYDKLARQPTQTFNRGMQLSCYSLLIVVSLIWNKRRWLNRYRVHLLNCEEPKIALPGINISSRVRFQ